MPLLDLLAIENNQRVGVNIPVGQDLKFFKSRLGLSLKFGLTTRDIRRILLSLPLDIRF